MTQEVPSSPIISAKKQSIRGELLLFFFLILVLNLFA